MREASQFIFEHLRRSSPGSTGAAGREGVNRSTVIRKLIDAGYEARAIEHLIASAEAERT